MINNDMKLYNYYTFGSINAYGQPVLSKEVVGSIKMAINISTQNTQANPLYENTVYLGLTRDEVDETFVIQYGNEKLKVQYVNPKGKLKQVYLARYEN